MEGLPLPGAHAELAAPLLGTCSVSLCLSVSASEDLCVVQLCALSVGQGVWHTVWVQFVQLELTGIRAGPGGRRHGTIPHTGALLGHSASADELSYLTTETTFQMIIS